MAWIKCGINSFTLLYLPLIAVFNIMRYYCAGMIDREMDKIGDSMHPITLSFIILFGELFGGIGTIYIVCTKNRPISVSTQLQRTSKDLSSKNKKFEVVQSIPGHKQNRLLVAFGIIGLSFLHFLMAITSSLLFFYFSNVEYQGELYNSVFDYEMISIQILFICILSYYILGYTLEKHQWLSIGLIAIGIGLILFPNMSYELKLEIRIPLLILIFFFSSIEGVFEKYLMEQKYISPHQFVLFNGSIGVLLCSLTSLIGELLSSNEAQNTIGYASDMFNEFYECLIKHTLFFFLSFFGCSLYALVIKLTRYYYTPTHCCVAETFCALIFYLTMAITNPYSQINLILRIIGYVLLVIGGLIYNEIIIIYCLRLQVNTKREIELRSKLDFDKDDDIKAMIKATLIEDSQLILI